MITHARISENASEDLLKVPKHIAIKLRKWVKTVQLEGLDATRQVKGYHDEPLQGKRKGQRSIRLNRSYRAIYVIRDEEVEVAVVEEVHKHAY